MYLIEVDNLTIVCTKYNQEKQGCYLYKQAYILDHHIDNIELDEIATILISKVYELCDDLYGGAPTQVMTIRTDIKELEPGQAPADNNEPSYSR